MLLSNFAILYILTLHCLDNDLQNDDEALLSISLAGHGLLVNMLITLEPHGIVS